MNEMEEWQDYSANSNSSNNSGGRDGYRGGYNRGYNNDRQRRPRFNSTERGGNPYKRDNNERAYRPQGAGNGDRRQNYSSRPGYNKPRGFGYENTDRPSFSNQHSTYVHNYRGGNRGGYNPDRRNAYEQDGQSADNMRHGGYGQSRGGYNQERPAYGQNRGAQRGGYNNRQGNYKNERQGGYKRQHTADYDPNAKYSMKKRIEYREYIEDPNAPIRLNKFLANAGVCSRREADDFIQAGVVRVNGEIATELGTKVQRTDTVHFHDQLISIEKKVYVLLNKPKDYVTTSDDPQQRKTVMELVKDCCRERIYPVGRLDRNTTGVLLFTNDGDLASKLTHPKFLKKKIYHVYLDKNVTAADLKQIAEGITLEDGEIHADAISYASDTDKKQVGIEIHSGKNRIVRRIFESLGYKVTKLDRVMFAGLTKKGLKRGDWRFLTEQEVALLHMGSYE